MKNGILLIFVMFMVQFGLFSQSCFPNGITFMLQSEIDNFSSNYPNCTEIEGDLIIRGNDITNLNGLISLTSVKGAVGIYDTDSLTTFNGLNNITSINGELMITANRSLENFYGLNNLTSIGGNLEIIMNDKLISINSLSNVSEIGFGIIIELNKGLKSLIGLHKITSISWLWIKSNIEITDLIGLDNLSSIEGHLKITGNWKLTTLNGLNNLKTINGTLWIQNNKTLVNLSDLNELSSIGGELFIYKNESLKTLEGLKASINYLTISHNSQLSTCDVSSICNFLEDPTGLVRINNNSSGCNTEEEIITKCMESVSVGNFSSQFKIYPNPSFTNVHIILDKSVSLTGLQFVLSNSVGKIVRAGNVENFNFTIIRGGLSTGLYYLSIYNDETVLRTSKLILQ